MKEHYVLTIKADDRPGLLHLITGMINRRLIDIESLNAAKTDISSIVLITIELNVSEKALTPLLLKLENIIEVYKVEAILAALAITCRSAYFKMDREFLETPAVAILQRNQASLVNVYPDAILLSKHGPVSEIDSLYRQLDGPHLLGFSQSGLIADSRLINNEDQSSVISMAA